MKIGILIDLDMLLDTRLGIAKSHFGAAVSLGVQPEYRQRLSDCQIADLIGIDRDEWDHAWASRGNRSEDILNASTITNLAPSLHKLIVAGLKVESDWAIVDEVNVVVNTYPYDISAEAKEMFASMLKENDLYQYPEVFTVTCEYIPYRHQTQHMLNMRGIDSLFIYDFQDWSSHRHEEWKDMKQTHHIFSIQMPKLATKAILDLPAEERAGQFEKSELFYRLSGLATITSLNVDSVCVLWDSKQSAYS